jgi:hypothetical protein
MTSGRAKFCTSGTCGPLATRSVKKPVRLVVTQRECNHSAFNGYRWTSSAYSTVMCINCQGHWRTKGAFVGRLMNAPANWFNMSKAQLIEWFDQQSK